MKITVYELLGLIKDNKAPKKIRMGEYEYEYCERLDGFCNYKEIKSNEYFNNDWFIENILNDEVEIIEDKPKHIEELANVWGKEGNLSFDAGVNLMDKINELSKAVNYLLDKDE
jgi:hypothetical protein